MKKRSSLLVATFGIAITVASFNFGGSRASATVPGTNSILNITPSGTLGSSSVSSGNGLSANGKFAVFHTSSNNLVSGDTNSTTDVFVRNLAANTTTRVDISSSGVQADNGGNGGVISETGRYVAFDSNSSNLIDGTTIPTTYQQVYLRDTQTNTTTLLGQTSSGTLANANVGVYDISADGRFILLASNATNLGPTVTNTGNNLYLLDRSTGSFTIVNSKTDGTLPTNTFGPYGRMSCDGSLIVFTSGAQLITTRTYLHNHYDIYLLDLRSGKQLTDLTDVSDGAAGAPSISCNGDYIGFSSDADDLDPVLTSNSSSLYYTYVYNRIAGTYSLVDQSSSGIVSNSSSNCNAFSVSCVAISSNGKAVFSDLGTNLVSPSTSNTQMFIRDINSGATQLLSQNSSGTYGNGNSTIPMVSSDGSIADYLSAASNLTSPSVGGAINVITSLTGL